MSDEIIIKAVEKLDMGPDDVLVLTVKRSLNVQGMQRLREQVKLLLPNRQVLVVEEDLYFRVIHSTDAQTLRDAV